MYIVSEGLSSPRWSAPMLVANSCAPTHLMPTAFRNPFAYTFRFEPSAFISITVALISSFSSHALQLLPTDTYNFPTGLNAMVRVRCQPPYYNSARSLETPPAPAACLRARYRRFDTCSEPTYP